MTPPCLSAIALAIAAGPPGVHAEAATEPPARVAGVVIIGHHQPSSLPTRLPTTIEGIDAAQLERTINAIDSEDALKYLPSLLVRKRYPGDYNHAVLSTRASGTGNSARSLVYADGVLLSNLLGNGAAFAPRWAMVTPEEIERVDVLYGPFSAAYPGNAVGAVVDYVTRLPQRFEAHAKLGVFHQPFALYSTDDHYGGRQASVSLGDRAGDLAWWVSANRLLSHGQPQSFATKLLSAGVVSTEGMPVQGAVAGRNPRNQDGWLIGTGTEYDTTQDHLKAKLAWDLTPTLRANLLLGWWDNHSEGRSASYLQDAAGRQVDNTTGGGITHTVNIDGRRYTLAPADFGRTGERQQHAMQALSLKTRTRGEWDWELAASRVDYVEDRLRAYAPTRPEQPQAGRLTDQGGTGWRTLNARGTWRPDGDGGAHVIDAGLGRQDNQLRSTLSTTSDWASASGAVPASRFDGDTRVDSAFVQDSWHFAPAWTTVLGLRAERWSAARGLTEVGGARLVHPERRMQHLSPKLALLHDLGGDWALKASSGRAIRYPTVSELYQGGFNARGEAVNNDPDLRPERSWTVEFSAEWTTPAARARATLFHEDTRDALYSQLNPATNANTVQNVEHLRTIGLELAASAQRGPFDVSGSLTYADSRIVANAGYLLTPGDTIGKWQPRVPRWRATLLATWRPNERVSLSAGARYSGRQFSALDNGDPNGEAYTGASRYFTADLRLLWRFHRQWSVAVGIDNLNNDRYWNFHPYPQRSYNAELKFDL